MLGMIDLHFKLLLDSHTAQESPSFSKYLAFLTPRIFKVHYALE